MTSRDKIDRKSTILECLFEKNPLNLGKISDHVRKMRICAFIHCSNSTYKLRVWKKSKCEIHEVMHESPVCSCLAPFELFPFPTKLQDPEARKEWIKAVYRMNKNTGKNWQPTQDSRICSDHFRDRKPTKENPSPSINLTSVTKASSYVPIKKRKDPMKRQLGEPDSKKRKEQAISSSNSTPSDPPNPLAEHDYASPVASQYHCLGCMDKDLEISRLKEHINKQDKLLNSMYEKDKVKTSLKPLVEKLLETDKKVNTFTGMPSKASFNSLCDYLAPKTTNMRYWKGEKRIISTKHKKFVKKRSKKPGKRGPKRKITVKDELLLTLVRLRLCLPVVLLAEMFGISTCLVSQILITWIKFLARNLRPLIFWPDRQQVNSQMPRSLRAYKNLRCTIDCSEVFIEKPRNLNIQALTWSDYKKHNTIKFLVGIAPNGAVCFLSNVWGGRASDQVITRNSGFLRKLEPGDLIMADRGFTIREDLLVKGATLEIPPPSSGIQQMTQENVRKTKKIANARIHVERAIGRMKNFAILKNEMPISLLPVADEIVTVCACLCNLLPPLVS